MVDPIDSPPQDALQQDAEADAPPPAAAQASAAPTPPPAPQQQVAEAEPGVPVPPSRPSELTVQPRVAEISAPPRGLENATPRKEAPRVSVREKAQATTLSQNDPRNFFEKLLGAGQQDRNAQQKGPQLAYASPDGGLFNPFRGATSTPSPMTATGGTAVYDIAAHTVYLPNGQALEAHSGLGPYFDDPNHVHMRMRGATRRRLQPDPARKPVPRRPGSAPDAGQRHHLWP